MIGVLHTARINAIEFIVSSDTHDEFDSVDPNSMQDTYHTWTQLNDLALHEFL